VGKKIVRAIIKSMSRTRNDKDFQDLDTSSNVGASQNKMLDSDDEDDKNDETNLIADSFLSRFLLISDTNTKGEINLHHALRALPLRFTKHNLNKIELMNLSVVQMSIIAFQNDDKDELFNFYDKRNKSRLHHLKITSTKNSEEMNKILSRMATLLERSMSTFGIKTKLQYNSESYDTFLENDKSESASDFM
jgi:hypothetical protein